jgi:hypothetical protein
MLDVLSRRLIIIGVILVAVLLLLGLFTIVIETHPQFGIQGVWVTVGTKPGLLPVKLYGIYRMDPQQFLEWDAWTQDHGHQLYPRQ